MKHENTFSASGRFLLCMILALAFFACYLEGDIEALRPLNIKSDGMIWVPGGTFMMGNNEAGALSTEKPVHQVTLDGFYIGKYPVTQGEWHSIMPMSLEQLMETSNKSQEIIGAGYYHPMYYISWLDAIDYCNKRSVKENLTPCYTIENEDQEQVNWKVTRNPDANGYRLPTEAEWEYAARGGQGTPGNYIYSGSDIADEVAWYSGNSEGTTHPVGQKKPNGLGIYDMSGNIYESCWDWYATYPSVIQENPTGPTEGNTRVARGGPQGAPAGDVRSMARGYCTIFDRYPTMGVRVARNGPRYTISFDANGAEGPAPAAIIVSAGSSITLPGGSGLKKDGGRFGGWCLNQYGTGIAYSGGSGHIPDKSVTLYAKWIPVETDTFEFQFDSYGGTIVTRQTVVSGERAVKPAKNPTKTGYAFANWFTAMDHETVYDFSLPVTVNTTVFAKWTDIRYKVTFNANGADGVTPSPEEVGLYNTIIQLPDPEELSKTDHKFGGWNTKTDGKGITYAGLYAVKENIILYAKWVPDDIDVYSISFNANGGSGNTLTSVKGELGTMTLLPKLDSFSRSGYTRGNWNTNSSGTGTNYAALAEYKIISNATIYVTWSALLYTVYYDANTAIGTPPSTQIAYYGSYSTIPNQGTLTKSGFNFTGWTTDSQGTNSIFYQGYSYYVTDSMTFYALWTNFDNPYRIGTSRFWLNNYLQPYTVHYYYYYTTAGNTHTVWWDDADNPTGVFNADIKVSVQDQITGYSYINSQDSGYAGRTITPVYTGNIVLKVEGFSSSYSGTYSIKVDF